MLNMVITGLIIVLLSMREKEVKLDRMWMLPVIVAVAIFFNISQVPLTGLTLLFYMLFLVIGCGIGLWRAWMERLRVDALTGKVMSKGSMGTAIVLIIIMLVKHYISTLDVHHISTLDVHHSVVALSSALLFIPLGSIAARRFIIYYRVRHMQAAKV
ncbi:hypothetical protein M3629_15240 [Paenibacillus polysaccharolyticus]|uniref:hypothetical protein n=1 Tax=Paenibacillus polysaccharolyticus TaxID=582692 RepID=UPI00203CD962|nr:hypothetical protein [Paenibacillus polysaccharolyticus]MCM3134146.1 hypothetical protein [Paenibacillus polysaccharolyticus]